MIITRIRWPAGLNKQIRKAKNDRQDIVEVMRYTASQLANGVHLLTLCEFQFEGFLFGGIDHIKNSGLAGFSVAAKWHDKNASRMLTLCAQSNLYWRQFSTIFCDVLHGGQELLS